LQQLYGLKQCNQLRIGHEKSAESAMTAVIRCRPDLMLLKPLDNLSLLDLSYVMFRIFTRLTESTTGFAIGCTEYMDIYMNKLDEFNDYVTDWLNIAAMRLQSARKCLPAGNFETTTFRFDPIRFGSTGQEATESKTTFQGSVNRVLYHAKPFHIPFYRT